MQASHKDQKKIHKTMSSGDLGKVDTLRKTPSQDGRFVSSFSLVAFAMSCLSPVLFPLTAG